MIPLFLLIYSLKIHFNLAFYVDQGGVLETPSLDFFIYLPKLKEYPYLIQVMPESKNNNDAAGSSGGKIQYVPGFILPRRGAFCILNLTATTAIARTSSKNVPMMESQSSSTLSVAQLKEPMEYFISCLHDLLGMSKFEQAAGSNGVASVFAYELNERQLVSLWLSRNRQRFEDLIQNMMRLVQSMAHMPIPPTVLTDLQVALTYYKAMLQEHQDICVKYDYSKRAVTAMESIAFHPTMMPKLHLPDMQKIALFLPIFLLVAMPVLTTLVKEGKAMKQRLYNL
jgi:hypothetical protein